MKNIIIIMLVLVAASCGKEIKDKTSSELSSSLTSSQCRATGEDYSGCCSSHGGAKKCGQISYTFLSSNRLVCNDNTVSASCVYR